MRVSSDDDLRTMLSDSKVVAVVGHSDRSFRTSYQIAQFLRNAGYKVYPVNPNVSEIDGEKCYQSLAEVPEAIDIVDVFRRSEYLEGVVEEAVEAGAKSVWAQLGVADFQAEKRAAEANMPIVMDRCIKIDHRRLNIKN
jgi:predicted CoA-binding protein